MKDVFGFTRRLKKGTFDEVTHIQIEGQMPAKFVPSFSRPVDFLYSFIEYQCRHVSGTVAVGTTIRQDSFLRSPPVRRVGLPNPVALNEAPQGGVWDEFTV